MRALHNAFYDPETDWEEDEDENNDTEEEEEEDHSDSSAERMSNKFLNFQKK